MVYFILKEIFRPALRLFYCPTVVIGQQHLTESGPLLIVANHPNTLMDPLLVGMRWRRQVHFLTKSVFFRGIGGWILRASGAIPIYRQDELKATTALTGAEWLARNDASFRATYDLLGRGGALLIFPEGTSVLERRLRPFKAGGARIALGAEAHHGWKLGLRIIPVGLNYAAADRFRSPLTIRIGPPLEVAVWRSAYETNPAAAARNLTEAIRQALETQLATAHSADDEILLPALDALAGPMMASASRAFDFQRNALRTLHQFARREPAIAAELRQRILAHHQHLLAHGLRHQPAAAAKPLPFHHQVRLVLSFPFWLWGLINHWPAMQLPALLSRRLTQEAEFRASIKMVLGIFTVPLFYAFQTALVWFSTGSGNWGLSYLFSLPLSGLVALHFPNWWQQQKYERQVRRLHRQAPDFLASLLREGTELRAVLGSEG